MSINETLLNYVTLTFGTSQTLFESTIFTASFILFASFILALIVDFIFEKIFKRITAKTHFNFDDLILSAIKKPMFYTVLLAGTYVALIVLYTTGNYLVILNNILLSIFILIWSFAAIRVNTILFENVFTKITEKTDTEIDDEILPLMKSITNILFIFMSLMILMKGVWSFDITPFLASAGVVGFAVAFAAKDAISHLFGGFSIYFDKPFKKGDRIEIDSAEVGIVDEIGIRSTKIRNFYNNMIIIPNSQIANSKIINYNYPNSKMMVKVPIGVAYGSDISKVKKILQGIIDKIPEVLPKPDSSVLFEKHGDFSLDFMLRMWVKEPAHKLIVVDAVNTAIDKEFKKAKIDIPFPTRTILEHK